MHQFANVQLLAILNLIFFSLLDAQCVRQMDP
jgi:hypothetical protein